MTKITPEQLEVLYFLLDNPQFFSKKEAKTIITMILHEWKLRSLIDMPQTKFMTALKRILELRDHYKVLRKRRDY